MADDDPPEPSPQPPEQETPSVYTCPHCSEVINQPVLDEELFLRCPHCGEAFSIGVGSEEAEKREQDQKAREDELSLMKIHLVSGSRRAAVRARTYLYIGCVLAATGTIKLLLMTFQRIRIEHRVRLSTAAFVLAAAVCLKFARNFWQRAGKMTRELAKPLIEEPGSPPDFSTLRDGSQVAKDLEEVR
jgi:hypothetical protein